MSPPLLPNLFPPEVDTERTRRITFQREVIQHRVFSDEQLRSTNTQVLVAFAPENDFQRDTAIILGEEEIRWTDDMGDIMGSMTSVNPPEWRLRSVTPSYPLSFLKAALPTERGALCSASSRHWI